MVVLRIRRRNSRGACATGARVCSTGRFGTATGRILISEDKSRSCGAFRVTYGVHIGDAPSSLGCLIPCVLSVRSSD